MRNITTIYFLYSVYDSMNAWNPSIASSFIEIRIPNIVPDTLGYSYSPNFSQQSTLGRMSPIQIYAGGSNKEYSFTISLHEDMLINTPYDSLAELVDAIKSLSYPTIDNAGLIKIPSVYFQIGVISGRGIINTSHAWKKPFRNGRYIMVDVSFNIIAEQVFPRAIFTPESTTTTYDGPTLVYTGITRISSSELLPSEMPSSQTLPYGIADSYINSLDTLMFGAYTDSTTNLVSAVPTSEEASVNIAFSVDYYDKTEEMINLLLANVSGDNLKNSAVVKLKDTLRLTDVDFMDTSPDRYAELDKRINDLDDLSKNFKTFLDYYYDNIDTSMTRDEYNKILDEIQLRIDQVVKMYRTVSSYAPSS